MAKLKHFFAVGIELSGIDNFLRMPSRNGARFRRSMCLSSTICRTQETQRYQQQSNVPATTVSSTRFLTSAANSLCSSSNNSLCLNGIKQAVIRARAMPLRFSSTQAGISNSRMRKRFYKNVTVTEAGNSDYQIYLDRVQLRTPLGTPFRVPTEPLALCVAAEWDAQKKYIKHHKMHLTKLCNTAIDNPVHLDNVSMVDKILNYLDNDTLCYRSEEPEALKRRQDELWDPVIYGVESIHKVEIGWSSDLSGPTIPLGTKEILRRFLMSYNFWALLGIIQAVESLKSVVLTVALLERLVSVEDAVRLACLETEFQTEHWGRVEWSHDVDALELNSLVASAMLFIVFNSEKVEMISMPQTS